MAQNQMSFLVNEELENKNRGPVECLGITFPNDQARREYFLEKLRENSKFCSE